ncbi:MAG TPA: XdhC family protein [Acidimicrobiia bacterium]|nr:XdhC family protein [Acidimicrobiia bacterium]HLE39158.1 XdhC family protein [Acidimicrobiia bacterium]
MAFADDLAIRDRWVAEGKRVAAATVISGVGSVPRPPGARLLLSSAGEIVGSVSSGCVEGDVTARAEAVLAGGESTVVTYGISDDQAFEVGLSCGGTIRVLIERW